MNKNEPFRKTISDFIHEKRAIGYKYDKNEQILKRVANLHEKMGNTESIIPKELVVKWAEKTPYKTETNRLHRISTLRGLAEYMQRIGLPAYLPGQRNVSTNTVKSYRDFRLLFIYFRDEQNIPPERIQMKSITRDLICKFLDWLEKERNCSITTRNQRLACIHSFIRYVQSETPENLFEYQRILGIPLKKGIHKSLDYLSAEAVSAILKQPEQTCKRGRRDLVLLTLLYDSGARVLELIDLTVTDLRLEAPATVTFHGKGRKMRCIPLMSPTVQLLKNYLSENELYKHPEKSNHPLFFNSRKQKLA